MRGSGYYIVLLKSSGKMLCPLITDLIVTEAKYGECLCGIVSER
jgi:hypothetical protein